MLKESLRVWVLDGEGNKVAFPNDKEQAVLSNWQYTAERMAGAPTITDSIMHTQCLDDLWTKKEFVELNGERFYISQVPTSEKDTDDVRYEHKVAFVSERSILENVFFFDCVTKEAGAQASDKPRSNTTDFSFFGTLTELVERLNDSLSYSHLYDAEGVNGFRIVIDGDIADTEAKEVTISDAYFATAMQEIYNVFDIPYYWDGKTCHVGFAKNEIEEPFEYGNGKGLLSVTKENSDFRIINRITGMGSSDNIPYYYPNDDPNGEAKLKTYNFSSDRIKSFALSILSKYVGNGMVGSRITLCDVAENTNELVLFDGENISQANDATRKHQAQLGGIYPDSGMEIDDPKFEVSMSFKVTATRGDVIDMSGLEIKLESGYDKLGSGAWLGTPLTRMDNSQMAVGFDCICTITLPDGTPEIYSSYDKKYDCVLSGTYTITFKCLSFYDISWTPVLDEKDNSWFSVWAKLTPYGKVVYTPKLAGKKLWRVDGTNNFAELDEGLITVDTYNGIPSLPMEYRIIDDNNTIGFVVSEGGDEQIAACVEVTDIEYIQPMSNLMPSVYRSTKGEERFYNALDNTYILEGETDYHKFTNPFVVGEPKEGIQDFEDIKPTINGIANAEGQLLGEVADIAFDDDDSDDMTIEGDNSTTATPLHSYFYVKLHRFSGEFGFNLFKQGLAQGAMTFNFISGSCAGCAFEVGVPEGKQVGNHYEFENPVQVDEAGNIVDGNYNDKVKKNNPISSQQDTSTNSVWIALKKDNSTFGVLMPNATNNYRPKVGDKFVITNILLPKVYITAAEKRLESALIKYMSENNDEKFTFSIKFSRIYLQRNPDIAASINENSKIHVKYNGHDYPLYVSSYSRKCDDNILDEVSVELSENLTIAQSKSQQQMDSILGNVNEQISNIKNQGGTIIGGGIGQGDGNVDLTDVYRQVYNKLSKVVDDVANGKITFKRGADFGTFVKGLLGGMGGNIDQFGNAELESLIVRQFIETPEFRQNKIDVVSGELWNSICFGTIERVDEKKRIVWLKLQEGELSGIEAGDICRGVFHCLEGSNPTESKEDECGFLQLAGFATSYFTPTAVYDNGASFKYSLRQGTSVHPQMGMKFAVYGSFTNPARRASAYMTRTYTRYLNKVDTWQVRPDVHIYGQTGDIEGLTINGTVMHGYGAYLHNLYLSGVHIEFDRDWIDHNLPKTYNVVLSTYERTVVTDIEGNPLNGLEELRNVVSGEGNVVSGEENVIATRLALTTTVQATKNGKPMLFSDVMDEGKFLVELNCVGCTARCENGVVKVTSLDMDSVEHRVSISVNCEGEAVYVQEFNVPVVKQGENGVTADLDNEMATVATNDKGEVIAMPEIVSNGRMWYGNEPMLLTRAEIEVPNGIAIKNITEDKTSAEYTWLLPLSTDKMSCKIEVGSITAAAADVNNIKVTMTGRMPRKDVVDSEGNQVFGNVEHTKSVVFKVNKAKMGENAINYQLLPSVSEIKATADGTLSESYISCGVTASDGKNLSNLSSLPNGLTMKYKVYNANSTSSETAYTINNYLYFSSLGVTKDSVRIVFYLYWNNVLIDKEGVPIVANGENGEDGNGISSVSTTWNVSTSDTYYSSSYVKYSTWQSSSPAVDYTYKYLWRKTITYYTQANSKTIYECIGKIGDKGIDGNGTEWIYYLNNSETFDGNDPSAWAASQEDDYIKSGTGWTDDPTGVSATKRFEWIAKRSKTNGTWGKFTPPHIWAKYGEKGEQGEPGVPGEPGADATSYWLDIEVTHVGLSASGSWSPSLIGMYVRKKKGDEAVSNCYDFYVSAWGYDGSNYTLVKAGSKSSYFYFSTSDAGKYSAFVIVLSSNDPSSVGYSSLTIVDRETITITTEKAVGSVLVDRGVFSPDNTYSWKYDNDRKCWMRDMVLYKASDGNYYRYAIKSMGQEGVTSYPSSTSYWEKLSTYKTIITDCLYTDNATIGGFYVNASQFWSANNNLTLDGKNGNITISGKLKAIDAEITGKITATSGTFDNCTIKDTCTITKIDAVKGTIGGFNITQYGITSSDGVVGIGSTGISLSKSGIYVALNVLNCMAPNETTLKDRAMFRIGTTSSYASDLVEITSDFMTVEVPIYFTLPKYASAKSGQLCRGDGDNHVYIHP